MRMKMLAREMGQSRGLFIQLSKQILLAPSPTHSRCLCTGAGKNPITNNSSKDNAAIDAYRDAYNKLSNMDFWTSAKIVFSNSPTIKKFGFDFHLVQLFFTCMPSLAVYLVAQYARSEMKKMDAELEKKKNSEEAKAKEMEAKAAEEKEKETANDPRILEVKERLDKLEETLKEIVFRSRVRTEQKDGVKGKSPLTTDSKSDQASPEATPEASSSVTKKSSSKDSNAGAPPISNAPQKDQKQAK